MVVATALGACTAPSEPAGPAGAESLWSARTEFVGDSSRMVALAGEAGFGATGAFSLSLQTEQEPYGLTVAYEDVDLALDDVDVTSEATLMLGLVANLGVVSVTSGDQDYVLTAAEASEALGFDVKELGDDRTALREYLERVT